MFAELNCRKSIAEMRKREGEVERRSISMRTLGEDKPCEGSAADLQQ